MDELSAGDAPQAPALTPRQLRARRRRRRRQLGTGLFLLVAVAVFATAYVAVAGGDDDSSDAAATNATAGSTTTTTPRPAGPYAVTTDVNVHSSPATTAATVGTLEPGTKVYVGCVAEGEQVEGPSGPNTQWLETVGFGPVGYLTSVYVDVGDDLTNQKIPACPPS
jgi:hypothetical protein